MALALPIVGGMMSQNLLGLVDTFMIGSLGDSALAGVAIGSFASTVALALLAGIGVGVQATAARHLGAGRKHDTATSLNAGLLMAFVVGGLLSAVLLTAAPTIIRAPATAPSVVEQALPYWQLRVLALVGAGMNVAFRGYWNGVSLSRLYFRVLLLVVVSNSLLNYVLIFGALGIPAMGTAGAGLASTLATYLGTACYFGLALKHARGAGFLSRRPTLPALRRLTKLALPASAQQLLLGGGILAFFALVERTGTANLAATAVLLNLLLVGILPSLGFGMAAASLVGQALGQESRSGAMRWGWSVARIAVVVVSAIALPALLLPDVVLGTFLSDPDTRALAVTPLRLIALSLPLDALGIVMMHSLMGAGATRTTFAVSSSLQWLVGLPLTFVLGPLLGIGLLGVWGGFMGARVLQAAALTGAWRRGAWAGVEV